MAEQETKTEQETKSVIATDKAYYRDRRVRPGDKLTVPGDFQAKWAVDANRYEPEPEPSAAEQADKAKEGLQGKRSRRSSKAT